MDDVSLYKSKIRKKVDSLTPIFTSSLIGDFPKNIEVPVEEDEFTEIFVGVQIMLQVIHEQIGALQKENLETETEKKRLETLIERLPVGIAIMEYPSGSPIMVNKKAKEIFGQDLEKNINVGTFAKAYNFTYQDGTPYPDDQLPCAVTFREKRPAATSDVTINRPEKTPISIKIQSVPVLNPAGEMISVIVVYDDITREKEIDTMKTDFISFVTHQLRTPLGNVRWNLEMIMGGDFGTLTPEMESVIKDIHDSNERMILLVNDILNVTKINQGRLFQNPNNVDVVGAIEQVLTEQRGKIQELKLTTEIKINSMEAIPTVYMDPEGLHEVLQNLITNAVKYSNEHGNITIFVEPKDGEVAISVADNGIGIPQNEQERIFTKFYRAQNALSRDYKGSGLGLFMVKLYVERWGGKVSFWSEEGKGSTFIVTIPTQYEPPASVQEHQL